MGCGCGQHQTNAVIPVLKLISEEIITRDNEIEVVQKFEDGTEKRFVVKRRNIGVKRKL